MAFPGFSEYITCHWDGFRHLCTGCSLNFNLSRGSVYVHLPRPAVPATPGALATWGYLSSMSGALPLTEGLLMILCPALTLQAAPSTHLKP